MSDDLIKDAEARGYSRGYNAGRKRRFKLLDAERAYAQERAFRDRAFLAALSAVITSHGWTTGDKKPITTLPDRVKLAWDFADEALKGRR